jgi:hypothetical protein
VIHQLVKNTMTPSPVSLHRLKLLREIELKSIARDSNIQVLIRRQAKRIYEVKGHTHKY